MGREVSYEDAVRLLGGDRDKVVRLIDTLLGVGMLVLVGPFRDVLGWFDAKAELSKVAERLVGGLVDKRSTLSRHQRTERLHAAHAVLAVTAFFEAMAGAELPFDYRDLELTAEEQRSLGSVRGTVHVGWTAPTAGPAESHEDFRARLAGYYADLAGSVQAFLRGLAVWERLGDGARERAEAVLPAVAEAAVERYDGMLGRLAAEFPEVAFWAGMREHGAVHARLQEVTTALAGMREVFDTIAAGREPDQRRRALARAYAAALERPIAASGEVPAGLCVPTLGEAFLPQLHRTVACAGDASLSNEDWWRKQPVRDDLLAFLTGYLTSPAATAAPLLILGQPGSGKSVLAKILAGQLPATDFLPVLVMLRAVPAAAELQDQIEQAIRAETGERVDWPSLARSAGDALPLVILDGFDELLQATAVSQTDYLGRVAAFQRREAAQGRPVAVVVTSRTGVADRAKAPDGATAVLLEPFDEGRVAAWLGVWNATNAARFTGGADLPLDLEVVLRYRDLAAQPLLLLMLALYDAEGNALRKADELRIDQLYERLLDRFVRREVDKLGQGLPQREQDRRVEAELRTLSVVAFAMFNRGAQWVTEAQLETDLQALPGLTGATRASSAATDLNRVPLCAAELALGSFFFVHRARASRDGASLETYEFLHATFGEFLVARLIHGIVKNLIAVERATTFPSGAAVDDDLLQALLSFAPLAGRRQAIAFVRGMVANLSDDDRGDWTDLICRLFRAAPMPRPPRAFDGFEPQRLSVPSRIAVYTANLVLLALCAGDLTATDLFGPDDARGEATVRAWRNTSRLWQSQRVSGWHGLIDLIAVDRIRVGERRDVALSLSESSTDTPRVDLAWVIGADQEPSPDHEADDSFPGLFVVGTNPLQEARREAHFTCDSVNDFQQHAIEPLRDSRLEGLGGLLATPGRRGMQSMLNTLLEILNMSKSSPEVRESLYLSYAGLIGLSYAGAIGTNSAGDELFLCTLAADRDIEPRSVLQIVERITWSGAERLSRPDLVRCILAHLDPDRDEDASRGLAKMLIDVLPGDLTAWTECDVESVIRVSELGLRRFWVVESVVDLWLARFAGGRPDFADRVRRLVAGADLG